MQEWNDKTITVVCGGTSTEREVSLRSGRAVYDALRAGGHTNVTLFDLTADNISDLLSSKTDIVFLALHGKGGEDGCIQGALELCGIPYTGPGVASSAVCMDKILTKQVLVAAGIPTAKFVVKRQDECKDVAAVTDELIGAVGLPMVLKSPCQGSSIGVVIVKRPEDMPEAIEEIFTYGDRLLAEEFLDGTEITVPILGNDRLTVLPDIEITSEREFYDYRAKYTSGLCHHIIPSRINESERAEAVAISQQAYRVLNCCGLSRVDLIVDKDKGPMVIEVNTLPGMTEMSLFPDAARAAGMSFEELILQILDLGYTVQR
jgi:D-alanine-D-alanine ligase